ncbi:MAG: hypothetical protein IPP15_06695 [Saprospiraceae bacterium]|uniref:Uncharacterized protein n=1 Tax=Candidatus Opimibacter skivensis TaxID=2982028 RepID=A0A9D7SUH8_9BACT|nr:hypothetical protein [Candidatus Opimibacter skivensis]
MIPIRTIALLPAFFMALSGSKCQTTISDNVIQKIGFDFAAVDEKGLINSETSIDYEFCIPMDETMMAKIKAIEPDVQTPRLAKGRIACSQQEWLCIVTTHDSKWKEKLYTIASLPFVQRIVQTDYE